MALLKSGTLQVQGQEWRGRLLSKPITTFAVSPLREDPFAMFALLEPIQEITSTEGSCRSSNRHRSASVIGCEEFILPRDKDRQYDGSRVSALEHTDDEPTEDAEVDKCLGTGIHSVEIQQL